MEIVAQCAGAARRAAPALASASDEAVDAALEAMARRLTVSAAQVLAANSADVAAAEQSRMTQALIDRLRLGQSRLTEMADQLALLAQVPFPPRDRVLEDRPDGLRLIERRRPVGVVGATFEARPNVTVDVASQLVKSRNAGVLRTGSAALRSALALREHVIAPALADAGLDPDAVQLVPDPRRDSTLALVRHPELIPLVIVRGSGETTRMLAAEGARHGVRVLAHADGGGVLYIDTAADPALAVELLVAGLDRLGVCNRVNLLLVAEGVPDRLHDALLATARQRGIALSLPPHDHPLGHEWALDTGREATLTVSWVAGPGHAAHVANQETSGLAATIVTGDESAAREFLDGYAGTGAFWNASTRLLDGFKLRRVPETGINVDQVPGPRGPVTFADLYLRQFVVIPARRPCG
ncbi:MAG: aldehyde dehydrogenase family protein [Pseudonocardiales bacterium]|nr:aldehyde dehydrogenase family protein [Pseudonocardiales bacterium]MBV9030891.1 aldehyde dehydrogenase family protein [Pseudonocardiales bacterium]